MRRKHFVIIGFIFRRIGVIISSGLSNIGIELAARDILRTFKKQMLEKMRKTGALRCFILRAYMIGNIQADNRRFMILIQNDMKPVGKIVFGISNCAGLVVHYVSFISI